MSKERISNLEYRLKKVTNAEMRRKKNLRKLKVLMKHMDHNHKYFHMQSENPWRERRKQIF